MNLYRIIRVTAKDRGPVFLLLLILSILPFRVWSQCDSLARFEQQYSKSLKADAFDECLRIAYAYREAAKRCTDSVSYLKSLKSIGQAYYYTGNFDSCIYYFSATKEFAVKYNLQNETYVKTLINIAQVYENFHFYLLALQHYELAFQAYGVLLEKEGRLNELIQAGIKRISNSMQNFGQANYSSNSDWSYKMYGDSLELKFNSGHSDWVISSLERGNILYTGSFNGFLKIWDKRSLKELKQLYFGPSQVNVIKSMGSGTVMVGLANGKLIFLDAYGNVEFELFNQNAAIAKAVSFCDDSLLLAIGDKDFATVWDIRSKKEVAILPGDFNSFSNAIILDQDMVTSGAESLFVWDIRTFRKKRVIDAHAKTVRSMILSKDSSTFYTASSDHTIKVWSARDFQLLKTLDRHTGEVHVLYLTQDNRYLISGGFDGKVIVWDLITYLPVKEFSFPGTDIIDIKGDGTYFFTCDNLGTINQFLLGDWKLNKSIQAHVGFIKKLEINSNNELISTSFDKSVKYFSTGSLDFKYLFCGVYGPEDWVLTKKSKEIPVWAIKKRILSRQAGTMVGIIGVENNIRLFDYITAAEGQYANANSNIQYDFAFDNAANQLILGDDKGELSFVDQNTTNVLKIGDVLIKRFYFIDTLQLLIGYDFDDVIFLVDSRLRKIIDKVTTRGHNFSQIDFLDDSSVVLLSDNGFVVYDFRKKAIVRSMRYVNKEDADLLHEYNANSKRIAVYERDSKKIRIYGISEGEMLAQQWRGEKVIKIRWLSDYVLLISDVLGDIYSMDTTGSLTNFYSGLHVSKVKHIDNKIYLLTEEGLFLVSPDMKNVELKYFDKKATFEDLVYDSIRRSYLAVTNTNAVEVFDANFKKIYTRIFLPNQNFVVLLPRSPYYMCTKNASKMMHFVTPGFKLIGFDQLDPIYNRPDIVLDSIGSYFNQKDQGLIDRYHAAWQKRIRRLALDSDKLGKGELAVPNAEIVNAGAVNYDNTAGEIRINVNASDRKYMLQRCNVLINEVPYFGSQGIPLAAKGVYSWDTTLTIPLSVGENKVQVSVMNELGLENFKYPLYVRFSPKQKIASRTYYIGIGVDKFRDKGHDLNYCVKDVQDLGVYLSSIGQVDTIVLVNQEVTREKVLALKAYLTSHTNVNDRVIISCSSHGILDDSLRFYLATHDIDFQHPSERGIEYEALEDLLDNIPARKKLLLLDACNSGENEKVPIERTSTSDLSDVVKSTRGVGISAKEETASTFQLMSDLFVNVRNNTGAVIIGAAGGRQSALEGEAVVVEGKQLRNGAFTFSLLEYLKENRDQLEKLTVNQLKQYVEKRVQVITGGRQKPTSRQETMDIDWRLY